MTHTILWIYWFVLYFLPQQELKPKVECEL